MENFTWRNKKIQMAIVAVIWIAVWQLGASLLDEEILLVSPFSVMRRILQEVQTSELWVRLAKSGWHIALGWLLGILFGSGLAVMGHYSSFLNLFFRPLISTLQAVPVVSFIILVLLWTPIQWLSTIISSIIVIPIAYHNVEQGLNSVADGLMEMSVVFDWGEKKRWKFLYIPALKPYLAAAFSTGMGLAWKSGLAAEVIGLPKSTLGEGIYESKIYLDMEGLFAFTIVAVFASYCMERGCRFLWEKFLSKK